MKKVFIVILGFLGAVLTVGGISGIARYFGDGESLAVIGGADGPTAIYFTKEIVDENFWSFICITVVGIVALIITLLVTWHTRKNRK